MRKILNLSFALFILAILVTPGLAYRDSDRGLSNIAPGTRFGREPLARKPYPYLFPVNPELWRQEQRERREYEPHANEPSQSKPAEEEPPAHKKPPIRPKFIEVK
jgi:hypothetical protein